VIRLVYDADAARARRVVDSIREQTAPRVVKHSAQFDEKASSPISTVSAEQPLPALPWFVVVVLLGAVVAAALWGPRAAVGALVAVVGAAAFTALLSRSAR
jgi:hypothetical protein